MLSAERGQSLKDAGINQLSISLDYLDERHDVARGIPGLVAKIFDSVDGMRARGIDNIRFNTVIKHDNIDQIRPIVARAAELGCGVNFSVYTDFKNGNTDHLLHADQQAEIVELAADLLAYKKRRRGVITNSDHYLERLPRYTSGEMTEPCESGMSTIHIDPSGGVRRCPDFPVDFHWREWRRYEPIDCNRCYYACRGEAQAPLRLDRIRDVMA
jgi:MoaA/NifB/PqqE/SkfB family radical SAM enzyme